MQSLRDTDRRELYRAWIVLMGFGGSIRGAAEWAMFDVSKKSHGTYHTTQNSRIVGGAIRGAFEGVLCGVFTPFMIIGGVVKIVTWPFQPPGAKQDK